MTGLVLGILGAFVYHWTLIEQVAIIIPSSFGVFLLTGFFDRGETPGRALLFRNLNTPIDVRKELKDSADFTKPVFRFLSRTICGIGLLSLLLLFIVEPTQRLTVLWFALLTLAVAGSLWFVRSDSDPDKRASDKVPVSVGTDS